MHEELRGKKQNSRGPKKLSIRQTVFKKRKLELATQDIMRRRKNQQSHLFPPDIFESSGSLLRGHDEIFRSSKE